MTQMGKKNVSFIVLSNLWIKKEIGNSVIETLKHFGLYFQGKSPVLHEKLPDN